MLRRLGSIALIGLISLILLELLFELLLRYFHLAPDDLRGVLRHYYLNQERTVVQYDPACAHYDSQLAYRLKPGNCHQQEREFAVNYAVNSVGLRDDESSLQNPPVIVLGDSFAMGWGVEQDETFSQRLEQLTGQTILNAGVSSFGTVRQQKLLDQLPTAGLQTLIIQYCDNDMLENQRYDASGNGLPIMSRSDYAQLVRSEQQKHYFPGKHTYHLLLRLVREDGDILSHPAAPQVALSPQAEANLFLKLLQSTSVDLSEVQIIVLELNAYSENDNAFVAALRQALAARPDSHTQVEVLDVSAWLDQSHYYALDGHINVHGHERLARELAAKIQENN